MASEAPETVGARRVGRPARINRESIARAVLEIGFEDATMKRVAEHLGVSVPGLYYYVRGRDDLLKVAAEHALAQTVVPEDRGQHWAQWLREWADHMRTSMAEREIMEQFIGGELNHDRMTEAIGYAIDVLVRDGFKVPAALQAFDAVSAVAVGTAVSDMRARQQAEAGGVGDHHLRAVVVSRDLGSHPGVRELIDDPDPSQLDEAFELRVRTVLIGIATLNELPIDDDVIGKKKRKAKRTSEGGRDAAG